MNIMLKAHPKFLLLSLLFSVLSLCLPFNPDPAVQADTSAPELVLGDFESEDETWDFLIGSNGALGNGEFTRDAGTAQSGASSGKLQLHFGSGSWYRYSYVMLEKYMFKRVLPVNPEELSFWVKTSDMARFDLILLDNTNQNHQQTIVLQPSDDWQKVTVSSFTSGLNYTKWGGSNDGVWHGPLKKMNVKLTAQSMRTGKTAGAIWFDDIRAKVTPPDLAIAQVQVGNVFSGSRTAAFDVLTTGDALAWTAYNAWGENVVSGNTAVAGGKIRLNVTVPEDGYYRLSLTASSSGAAIKSVETTFAALPAFDVSSVTESPFGVQTHFGINWNREMTPLLKHAGTKNVRDSFYWSEVELTQNQYTFNPKTTLPLQSFRDFGIDPLLVFGLSNKYYDAGKTPHTEAAHIAYGNYVKAMLNKFGSQLKWGEVWNEFNLPYFGGNGPAASRPDVYFSLLQEGYEAIKSVRPDLTVVGGVTADVPLDWLTDLFELGGLDYMDTLSVHPYRYPETPEGLLEEINHINDLVSDYNDGQSIPIWFSEIGWPTHLNPTGVNENTQAAYLIRSYVLSMAAGVEKIFWYNLMDSGTDKLYNEHNFGIVHNSGDALGAYTPKPAYVALSTLTRQLTGATSVSQDVADGVHRYTFNKNNEEIHVIWSLEPENAAFATSNPLTVIDMMGRTTTYTPVDGKVHVTLSGEPLFIHGSITSVEYVSPYTLLSNPAYTGDSITVTLQVGDLAPASGLTADISFQGVTQQVTMGGPGDYAVQFPGMNQAGNWRASAVVYVNGTASAELSTMVEVMEAEGGSAKHVLRNGEDVIEVLIQNERETDRRLIGIDWSIGALAGSETYDDVIAANGALAVNFPLAGVPAGTLLPYSFEIVMEDGATMQASGTVKRVEPAARVLLPYRALDEMEDLAGLTGIDLITDVHSRIAGSAGPEDFSGTIWSTYDEENLYVYARVHDDTFSQTSQGETIWQGDSIQFAVSAGMPGEQLQWYEYGMALTAQGPELYRWMAPQGYVTGTIQNPQLQITRDETAKDTMYQLALPWTELAPVVTSDGLLSLSIVVNENDGSGRKGYVEWGSGIGSSKQSSLFKPIELQPQPQPAE